MPMVSCRKPAIVQYIDAMIDGTRFDALRNLRPAVTLADLCLPKVS